MLGKFEERGGIKGAKSNVLGKNLTPEQEEELKRKKAMEQAAKSQGKA